MTRSAPPAIAITGPASGQTLPAGFPWTLHVNASDPDGQVSLVDDYFWEVTTGVGKLEHLGTSTAAPFSLTVPIGPQGIDPEITEIILYAAATDNDGWVTVPEYIRIRFGSAP